MLKDIRRTTWGTIWTFWRTCFKAQLLPQTGGTGPNTKGLSVFQTESVCSTYSSTFHFCLSCFHFSDMWYPVLVLTQDRHSCFGQRSTEKKRLSESCLDSDPLITVFYWTLGCHWLLLPRPERTGAAMTSPEPLWEVQQFSAQSKDAGAAAEHVKSELSG